MPDAPTKMIRARGLSLNNWLIARLMIVFAAANIKAICVP
jgi:hypothetical protein